MPTELRRITFTNAELRIALDEYFALKKTPLPLGVILKVRLENAAHVLSIQMAGATDNDEAALVLTPEQVAAALLRYCKSTGIPVPKKASKSLAMSGDNLALDIRSGETAPLKAAASAARNEK